MELKSSCCEKYKLKGRACKRYPVMVPLSKKKRRGKLKKIRKRLARGGWVHGTESIRDTIREGKEGQVQIPMKVWMSRYEKDRFVHRRDLYLSLCPSPFAEFVACHRFSLPTSRLSRRH